MKNNQLKNTSRSLRALIFLAVGCLIASPARAATTTWSGLGDQWSSAGSWTNGIPVNGSILVFSAQGTANPISYYSLDLTVPGLTFSTGAPSYTIYVGLQKYLTFNGTGITNLSGVRQTIINQGEYSSGTFFENAASAGDTYIENHNAGSTGFYNTATAGTSHIENFGSGDFSNTYTKFWDSTTAGSSTIINHVSPTSNYVRGFTDFADKSSAGSSTLINDGGGVFSFTGTATAATSTIISTGGTGINSLLLFDEKSTAANAVIQFAGGKIWFSGTSKSASADITASTGTEVTFDSTAVVANTTAFTINGTSNLYLSNLTNPTVGSLAGNGRIEWSGSSTLTVGNLNRDTTVSGIFTGGNLTKQGTGTLTLNPTQTYSGNTTVTAGAIAISQWSALGAGSLILTSGGTLRYTGAEASTNRLIQFGTTAAGGSGVIDSSGTGALTVSNAAVAFGTTNQTRTVILGGTNTDGNIFAPSLSTNGTAVVSLQKTGTGTWKLTGDNTYTGTTSVFGGTLKLGSARTTAAPVVVNATATDGTATFALDGVDATISTLTFGGATAGAGGINTVATGANTLTISGTSAITYTATNNPGAALLSGKLDLGGSSHSFNIGDSTAAANDLTVSAIISGAGGVTKTGLGTLLLSGANIFSGAATVNGGTLKLGASTAFRAAGNAVTVNTTLAGATAATLDLANNNASVTGLTFGGTSAVAGSTNSVTTGTGTLTLVGAGSITTSATNNPGSASISGKLNLGDTARTFTIADSTGAASDLTISAVISGNSAIGFTKAGAGVLTISADNTYSGATTVTGGILSVASFASLGTATSTALAPNLILSGGTLRYTGGTTSLSRYLQIGLTAAGGSGTIDSSGTGALTVATTSGLVYGSNNQTRTVILGGSNTDANTFAALLANNGTGATSLQKTGLGSWTISRANTFSGGTTISNGTLVFNAAAALGTGGISVSSGTLLVASGVAISNAVSLSGGSYDRAITATTSFTNFINSTSNFAGGAPNTTASLLGGQASAATTLHSSFEDVSTATNDVIRLSDVYTLSDVPVVNITTGQTDTFVLQLAVSTVLADSYLGWLDSETNTWVNAVLGNIGGTSTFAGDRAYNPLTDFTLGTWGVDSVNKTVWAVLDHNSDFAVVPEPATWLLLILSAAVVLLFRRRATSKR